MGSPGHQFVPSPRLLSRIILTVAETKSRALIPIFSHQNVVESQRSRDQHYGVHPEEDAPIEGVERGGSR